MFRSSALVPGPINYNGSLAGVNAKLLIAVYDSPSSNLVTYLNNCITSLNGTLGTYSGSTGIYINYLPISGTNSLSSELSTGIGGYDSNYDAILACTGNPPASDFVSILNAYYNNNKGVLIGLYGNTTLGNSAYVLNVS